jgi:hypothetical protein
MISPTSDDYLYIGLGLLLGYLMGFNRVNKPKVIVLDEELENELEVSKNLNESLLEDKALLQEQLAKVRQELKEVKYDNRTRPNTTTN